MGLQSTTTPTKMVHLDRPLYEKARLLVLQRKVDEPKYSLRQFVSDAVARFLENSEAEAA